MVELLAPAGEYNSFLGAISAGADAVYLAGNMYGARASAQNFTEEELLKAIKYAHLFKRKVYLTVNTLTKDEELEKLYDFLYPLYVSGLDSVIVQDIGVFFYIKENFPELDIHVSTQAVVTSEYGARFYTDLGAKRVVLARELTLDEIKKITAKGIETECFIHGAMCYSYSGMCLFSSFLGGNSGNRGRCKGPCRQPYKIENKEGYYLSLSDMNTLDIIDKLIDSGIYSFKIEGRLKSPSYAAGVTSVYRKYIDKHLENPDEELRIEESDRELLKFLYSRVSTGRGYYERVSSKQMVTIDKGAYTKVDEKLEKEIISRYIDDPLKKDVDINFSALTGKKAVLRMSTLINDQILEVCAESESEIEKALKQPTSKEEVLKQLKKLGNTDFVLKNSDISLDDGFVASSLINNLRREAVYKLSNKIEDHVCERTTSENKKSVSEVSRSAIKVLSDKFDIKDSDNDKLIEKNAVSYKEFADNETKHISNCAFVTTFDQLSLCAEDDFFDSIVVNKDIIFDPDENDPLKDKKINDAFEKLAALVCKKIYIKLPPVLRSLNERSVGNLIKYAEETSFIDGIYVNQYDQYYFARNNGFTKEIHGGSNIYSYNDISSAANNTLFVSSMFGRELSFKDMININTDAMALVVYGKASLMHTANCIMKTTGRCTKFTKSDKNSFVNLKDRTGADFKVKLSCDDELCFNTVINSVPTSLHNNFDKIKNLKIYRFLYVFTDESKQDVKEVTDTYKSLFNGQKKEVSYKFTAYHFKNGIL